MGTVSSAPAPDWWTARRPDTGSVIVKHFERTCGQPVVASEPESAPIPDVKIATGPLPVLAPVVRLRTVAEIHRLRRERAGRAS